ncbi:hypothetical protein EPICR_50205 [Candidatus Desulfarcum epimagneticum]|uniref:Uncharacterized protein n=1 Tax=uncultured Desulfobacteraceae bacterium TaxID=218296 RepID=A0A484HKJ3_9BACT|nr:hypothetical protein EPICR_50205 [uncultured Desulfobacteraceae bacterium]
MRKKTHTNTVIDEAGEKRLAELIKEAGEDARSRRKKVMEEHYDKIRAAIRKGVSNRQDFIPE